MGNCKYLQACEEEIRQAEANYILELEKLQEACEHKTILEHVDAQYDYMRVCEDCGLTARRRWGAPAGVLRGRAYTVSRAEYVAATPFRKRT